MSGRQGWAESAPSFIRAWPGLKMSCSLYCPLWKGPSPSLGGLHFYFKARDAEYRPLVGRAFAWTNALALGLAHWGPGNRAAEGLPGQGPSLQILAVSGCSSRQIPKLSSAVRQSTGRSWVPLPQVTEHCRRRVPSQGPPPMLWVRKSPSRM